MLESTLRRSLQVPCLYIHKLDTNLLLHIQVISIPGDCYETNKFIGWKQINVPS
jgi:hypothetical protein